MNDMGPRGLRFDVDGLVPAVVQDVVSGDVLMLAYLNDDALRLTYETGRAHFWSRSRNSLWRKGETSGHEQVVDEIRVNCEQNSLLLLVRQVGSVCHDGYPTCFYRQLMPDGSMIAVREQTFDPRQVYGASSPGSQSGQSGDIDRLEEATRRQFSAYAYLRDHDLTRESLTSRRLRAPNQDFRGRIADELDELAGVLDHTHRHADRESDVVLESSQVIYWVLLQALYNDVPWSRLRPDRALATADDQVPMPLTTQLLRAEAGRWSTDEQGSVDIAATAHATLALVGQACASVGLDPLSAVEADLTELKSRPYLASFFSPSVERRGFDCQDDVHLERAH